MINMLEITDKYYLSWSPDQNLRYMASLSNSLNACSLIVFVNTEGSDSSFIYLFFPDEPRLMAGGQPYPRALQQVYTRPRWDALVKDETVVPVVLLR